MEDVEKLLNLGRGDREWQTTDRRQSLACFIRLRQKKGVFVRLRIQWTF